MAFSVAGLIDCMSMKDLFILSNIEYSAIKFEGPIAHDHPSRAHENLVFHSSSQPFITFQAPENPVHHDLVNRI